MSGAKSRKWVHQNPTNPRKLPAALTYRAQVSPQLPALTKGLCNRWSILLFPAITETKCIRANHLVHALRSVKRYGGYILYNRP